MTTMTATPATAGAVRDAGSRPSLLRLTGVELRKLIDTRAGFWLLATIGLIAAGIVAIQLVVGGPADRTFMSFFGASVFAVALLLPVLGILLVTSEWSQRTAMTTFALVPRRERIVVAKIGAGLVAAALSVVASLLVAAVATLLVGVTVGNADWGIDGPGLLNATLFQVLNTLIGVAFGMWLLNSPLAIVLYFALPTVWAMLTGMVSWLRDWAQWLDTTVTMAPLIGPEVTAGQWARLGVSMLVWLVAPMLVGFFRIMRREIS